MESWDLRWENKETLVLGILVENRNNGVAQCQWVSASVIARW